MTLFYFLRAARRTPHTTPAETCEYQPRLLGWVLGGVAIALLALAGLPAWAQGGSGGSGGAGGSGTFIEKEWVESVAPPAPAFSREAWLPLQMPHHVTVKVGIDPKTIAIGEDAVVRYVAVMVNATGSVFALYEGLRCDADEVKTYARLSSAGQWVTVAEPVWKPTTSGAATAHAFAFARNAACPNKVIARRDEMIRSLQQPLQRQSSR